MLCGLRQLPTFSELLGAGIFLLAPITSEWELRQYVSPLLCFLRSLPGPSRHLSATSLTLECWRHCPRGCLEPSTAPLPQAPPASSSEPFCSHRATSWTEESLEDMKLKN